MRRDLHLNWALRRIDWRFLLPEPRVARTAVAPTNPLRHALRHMSDHVVDLDDAGAANDIVVLRDPDHEALVAACNTLRQGGSCYCEWFAPTRGWRARLRTLERAGFAHPRAYWPWPWPGRGTPAFWLPLDARSASTWFAASRRKKPGGRVLGAALQAAWWAMRRSGRLVPVCAIARRAPGDAPMQSGVLDVLLTEATRWRPGPAPRGLACFLLTGGQRPVNKLVLLVFADDDELPHLVVKLPRVPESREALEREAANLRKAHDLLGSRLRSTPRLLFSGTWAGEPFLCESRVDGDPLYEHLEVASYRDLAHSVTDLLIDLSIPGAVEPGERRWTRLVEPVLTAFEDDYRDVAAPHELARTRTSLAGLGDLPLVVEQRDFSPWNVHVTRTGDLAVLDWESAEPRGLPLCDLVYFLTYCSFFLDGAMASGRFRSSYVRARDGASFTGRIFAECEARYARALGLDPRALGPLRQMTWLIHARSERAQVQAVGGARTGTLRQGRFLQLWEHEVRAGPR